MFGILSCHLQTLTALHVHKRVWPIAFVWERERRFLFVMSFGLSPGIFLNVEWKCYSL